MINNELETNNPNNIKSKHPKIITVLLNILIALHIPPALNAMAMYRLSPIAIQIVGVSALIFLIVRIIKPKNIRNVVVTLFIISLVCQYYVPTYVHYIWDYLSLGSSVQNATISFFHDIQYGALYAPSNSSIILWIVWLVVWLLCCYLSSNHKKQTE
ncbi:hypothetical protein [Moraxella sp. ZY200743]|uniref:hypothetical protein n=1 Tax=Moraxella sp. ZY200743 TaxID=2911970 RepID=UPI003D7E81B6